MGKVGIRQVAEAVGVSVSTVSKAFNPNSGAGQYVTEATLERVREAARTLGYTPSYGATLLRGQSSRTIGFSIAMPEDTHVTYLSDYPVRILNGLGPMAAEAGYQTLLLSNANYQDFLKIKRIDALVLASFHRTDNPREDEMIAMFEHLNQARYPYIVINNHNDRYPCPAINSDTAHGIKLVVELIERKGFETVGFLGELTPCPQLEHIERCRMLSGLLGEKFRPESVLNGSGGEIPEFPRRELYSFEDGWHGAEYLVRNHRLPRCLVCGNDDIAAGALAYFADAGIPVPGQVAVIGFDGDPRGRFLYPSLTTVVQPLEEFGRLAFEYLKKKWADPDHFETQWSKPYLLERKSC